MRQAFLIFVAGIALWSCSREESANNDKGPEQAIVTFNVAAETVHGTRAVADGDGAAAKVNHWIMEVRDVDGDVYARQEKDGTEGAKTQTFNIALIKGQTYNLLFWADTKGSYIVDNLKAVKLSNEDGYAANLDSRDAFSAVKTGFSTIKDTAQSITLKRPFAQLNVIFTDLDTMYKQIIDSAEYTKFKPSDFKVKAKLPTTFNVENQTVGSPSETDLEITADSSYLGNYAKHRKEETLFMDYFFASSSSTNDVVDIDFSFVSKGVTISHKLTSIPFSRNHRTNIKGKLMTANAKWNVTIDSDWTAAIDSTLNN